MDIVRSTIFIAVTGVQWMFSRKTFACASDGWGLGLGLAWRLVAQLVVAAASLSHDQLQPAQPSEQGEIFCSLFFLGETDHLGSIVGGILLVGSLYTMLWG